MGSIVTGFDHFQRVQDGAVHRRGDPAVIHYIHSAFVLILFRQKHGSGTGAAQTAADGHIEELIIGKKHLVPDLHNTVRRRLVSGYGSP